MSSDGMGHDNSVEIKIEAAIKSAHDEADDAGHAIGDAMIASHVAKAIAYVGEAIVLALRERR